MELFILNFVQTLNSFIMMQVLTFSRVVSHYFFTQSCEFVSDPLHSKLNLFALYFATRFHVVPPTFNSIQVEL